MIASLQKNYALVLISLVLALLVTFVINLFHGDQDHGKRSYIEAAVVSVVVSTFTVWIHTLVPRFEEISVSPPPF